MTSAIIMMIPKNDVSMVPLYGSNTPMISGKHSV